ncbi:tumor necrosis factor alpha-induced protein 2-like isoform X3 [Anguilla anguilla]|uniref:tumor necrosis factor alpha-induced protein 2-like isoform X3 n=1 Tax=Anguilla anguilla TaxID=7936 RepID=UPI0015AFFDFB|nr:tumor necrosis factor alpha-induced protein 2-like isoform X3 [Anguilla anguilla]
MKDHPAEEVKTLKDVNENGAASFEQPPVVSSAENHKHVRYKIKLPEFKKWPRSPKAAIDTVDSTSTIDHPAEEVKTLKDVNENGAASFEQPPVVSSAENHKHVKYKIKLPEFKKWARSPKAAIDTVDSTSTIDHPAEDVNTLKDDNENGAASFEQPPVVSSAESQKRRKRRIKFPKFKNGPRSPQAAVDSALQIERSFKENIEEKRLKEADCQLINREEYLFLQGAGQEGVERRGRDKEEAELQEDYESLLVLVRLAIQNSFSAEPGELDALRSAVSVILQEEEQDRRWLEETGVEAPVWRPRQCRHTHDGLLQVMVEKRMECMEDVAVAERLSSSLKKEVCKMGKQVHVDLLKVVQDVKTCYPAEFNVCDTYARLYHQALSSQLVKMAELDLNFDDRVYLLCWVHNYYPNDVLKHEELEKDIDIEALGPLLPEAVVRPIEEKYLSQKEIGVFQSQLGVWVSNALKQEENRWRNGSLPELILDHYYSTIAIDVIEMVDAAVKETKAIFCDSSRAQRIMCQLEIFLMRYKKSLEDFIKEKHVNTNAVLKANLASIEQFKEYLEKCADLLPEEKNRCLTLLEDMENYAYCYFLDVMHAEFKVEYKQLWTQAWLERGSRQLVELLEKHIWDCENLKPTCKQELVSRLHVQVILEYVRRMMKGKLKLKNKEQQEGAASLLFEDSKMLNSVFIEAGSKERWLQDILPKIAEVLRLQDPGSIQLEVITLAQCYPDLSDKHVSILLHLKNLSRDHIRRIKDSLAENRSLDTPEDTRSFFSRVRLPKFTTKI